MKKTVTLFISFMLLSAAVAAQIKYNPEFRIGYGYYESFNLGFSLELRNDNKIAFGAGSSFILNNDRYFSLYLEDNIAVFRSRKYNFIEYKWFFTGKILYWKMEDDEFRINVFSLSPSLTRRIPLNSRLGLTIDAGPIYNFVLKSHSKTSLPPPEPNHIMPNIRILLNLKL